MLLTFAARREHCRARLAGAGNRQMGDLDACRFVYGLSSYAAVQGAVRWSNLKTLMLVTILEFAPPHCALHPLA